MAVEWPWMGEVERDPKKVFVLMPFDEELAWVYTDLISHM